MVNECRQSTDEAVSVDPVIPNFTHEDQLGMEKRGVLHFGSIQQLAWRTISASAELLVHS